MGSETGHISKRGQINSEAEKLGKKCDRDIDTETEEKREDFMKYIVV